MQIVKTGEWTKGFDGTFRILVVDECDGCGIKLSHFVQYANEPIATCLNGSTRIDVPADETPESAPIVISVFTERKAHNAECVRCSAAGQTGRGCEKWGEFFSRIKRHEAKRETPFLVRRTIKHLTGYVDTRTWTAWTEREARAWKSIAGTTGLGTVELIDQSDKFTVTDYE